MKLEMDANEILDSTTATKLAEAYLYIMKERHDTINFSCVRPKYNHLEIGDIIDFSNWSSTLKIYGAAMTGYFIVADITKTVSGCSIKAIKVS
jgi:ASC-1-like (ASCH) protein